MKFNPLSNELYTNEGTLIKKLQCPLQPEWDDMHQGTEFRMKHCQGCQRPVYDTAFFKDNDLLEMVEKDRHTCLKVDLNQNNLIVTY